MVPAYVRVQEDLETGQLVDLKGLAESLELQFEQVENIEQAYQLVHGTKSDFRPPSFRPSDLNLSKDMEVHLVQRITSSLQAGDEILSGLPKNEKAELLGNELAVQLLRFRTTANQAYRSGELFYAYQCATQWAAAFRARELTKGGFANIKPDQVKSQDDLIRYCDAEIAQVFKSFPDSMRLSEELSQRMPPIASQFCTDVRLMHSTQSMVAAYDIGLETQLSASAKPAAGSKTAETEAQQAFSTILEYKAIQLITANAAKDLLEHLSEETAALSNLVEPVRLDSERMLQVERLFYTAYASAHQVLETNVVGAVAAENGGSRQTALATLVQADLSFAGQIPLPALAAEPHEKVQKLARDGKADGFLTALNAQCCADHLADVAGIVVRWTELDAEVQADGSIAYGRLGVLAYMLRTARENALLNIARCRRTGVPCPAAIYHFERAECTRDDPSEDKVNALVSYWQASLQAQALRMLFRPQKS